MDRAAHAVAGAGDAIPLRHPASRQLLAEAWRLTPAAASGTRLVTRIRAACERRHPLTAMTAVLLMEFGDFAMLRRMRCGIKSRAESPRR